MARTFGFGDRKSAYSEVMADSPRWVVYLLVMLVLGIVSAAFAGFIAITASLMKIGGVSFWPLFTVFSLLYVPAGAKRMADAVQAGPEQRLRLMSVREQYSDAVLEHPELRAYPESTSACLMAASAILVRASIRAWVVMIVAILFFRAIGSKMDSDLRPMWLTLTALEAFFIGSRAYRRGTLALTGMGTAEMERYCRNRIDHVDEATFVP